MGAAVDNRPQALTLELPNTDATKQPYQAIKDDDLMTPAAMKAEAREAAQEKQVQARRDQAAKEMGERVAVLRGLRRSAALVVFQKHLQALQNYESRLGLRERAFEQRSVKKELHTEEQYEAKLTEIKGARATCARAIVQMREVDVATARTDELMGTIAMAGTVRGRVQDALSFTDQERQEIKLVQKLGGVGVIAAGLVMIAVGVSAPWLAGVAVVAAFVYGAFECARRRDRLPNSVLKQGNHQGFAEGIAAGMAAAGGGMGALAGGDVSLANGSWQGF